MLEIPLDPVEACDYMAARGFKRSPAWLRAAVLPATAPRITAMG